MSEYQSVHFLAIDRPLDDQQLEFMEMQSSRATVTRREFTNEYHFGNFTGKTQEMMRRGFDLHVHFARFGIRKLVFRMPFGFPGGMTILQSYLIGDNIHWDQDDQRRGGILTIHPAGDGGSWDGCFNNLEPLLNDLTPVREMLINGDLRPLYLAWLETKSEQQRLKLLTKLLKDESGIVGADALQPIRKKMSPRSWPVTPTNRTMEERYRLANE